MLGAIGGWLVQVYVCLGSWAQCLVPLVVCLELVGPHLFSPVVFPGAGGGANDVQWCFSQVKGAIDDDVAEGKHAQEPHHTHTHTHALHILLLLVQP